ncbi:hypothetical protein Acr_07g0012610 [Actinidia rufa]|uniref:Reverse transcriptase zinc-binding domain-containing protein n=1 Tax=Actinidia rufa TaxID=165716 RepID=A0A7J0EX74_9ERIC|nr:hypothetical protein Acr_07g0012610 [Actinidia rufa]
MQPGIYPDIMINKISGYISAWAGANLSYAGRTELIKSVLQGVECFWLSILPTPAGVQAKIIKLCRNFLWSGKCNKNKRPLVAWRDITPPKIEGGLGIRNSKAWNKALLSKTMWDIQAKIDTLWVQWVHQIYMKYANFWEYQIKHDDSPLIKQVIALREEIIATERSQQAEAHKINQWMANGELNSKLAYEYFRPKAIKLQWPKVIWTNYATPKHAFIFWLAMKEKLLTKDRLHDPGANQLCSLCRTENETAEHFHLFFQCNFVRQVWNSIKRLARVPQISYDIKSSCQMVDQGSQRHGYPIQSKKAGHSLHHLFCMGSKKSQNI